MYKKIKIILKYKFLFICSFFLMISFLGIVKYIKKEKKEEKGAIIFVPGICGSELFYKGEGNKYYSKGDALLLPNGFNIFSINQVLEDVEKIIKNFELLECDKRGLPINKNVGVLKNISNVKKKENNLYSYGILYLFKDLIDFLTVRFGKNTTFKRDVIFFNYDWRLSCATNGDLLIKIIEKYDKVTLIGYSLGGLISCKAMCNLYKQSKLNKIENYISIAVPYNGAVLALYALLTGFIEENKFFNFFYKNLDCDEFIKKLLKNFSSIYELLPTEKYFSHSKGYLKNTSGTVFNYLETLEFLEKNPQLNSVLLKNAVSFHKSLFIKRKHILEYIKNKFFIIGTGYDAVSELTQNNGINISAHENGDGTIEMNNSALPPIKNTQNLNIYKVKSTHVGFLNNKKFFLYLGSLLGKKLCEK